MRNKRCKTCLILFLIFLFALPIFGQQKLKEFNNLTQYSTEEMQAKAENLFQSGHNKASIQVLRQLLTVEPMSGEAYLLLGKIHLRRSETKLAVSSFKTALFWNDQLIEAHFALARIFLKKKFCLQAKKYSKMVLELDSTSKEAIELSKAAEVCRE